MAAAIQMKKVKAFIAASFFVLSGMSPVSASQQAKIEAIRYQGLKHVLARDLDGLVPLAPGDACQEDLIPQAEKTLSDYYARRGFYEARVKISIEPKSPSSCAISVQIHEGEPCIIKSIWIDDPPGFKSKSVMNRFKDHMHDVVKLKAGERYDELRLSDSLRELRDWLIKEDFILANTDKVKLNYSDDKRAVSAVITVDYGDRVTFGFQGNTVFTKGELNDFISQARATGLGKDYIGVIQRKFLDEYRNRAYNNAKVELKYSENAHSNHVTFIFSEGTRTRLNDLKWEGLSERNSLLAQEVFSRSVSRLVQRGYFVEKDVDKGILVVLEELKSQGYLMSRLVAKTAQQINAPRGVHRVNVTVQIAEGEQTLVGKVNMLGFSHLPADKAAATLGLAPGNPFNPFALEEGLQKLKATYASEGYLNFQILTHEDHIVSFTDNNRQADIMIQANEGTRVKIGFIDIRGLDLTKTFVVSRELAVKSGDWWLGPPIQETETNLRKLGLFSNVKIMPRHSVRGPGYRDMLIQLQEIEPGVIEAGPGYRTDLGARGFARVSYNNMFGRGWIGTLGAEGNRRLNNDYRFFEYKLDTSFVEPRFFGSKFIYSVELSTRKERFPPDFNAVSSQFTTGFERKFAQVLGRGTLSTKIAYKLERIRQFDVFVDNSLPSSDNRSMLIGAIAPSIALDARDNPFATTSGFLSSMALEYAHPTLSSQDIDDEGAPAYQKWTTSTHIYVPLTKDIVWSNVIAGGFARSNVAGRPIPLIKLFRLGGYNTIRGFAEDSINVDAYNITGTLTYLNLRTQFDLPLVGDLKFAPFLDAGNLYIDRLQGSPFFRAGAGVGLHYSTPVGPINLDWGYKLNPVGGDTPSQIHFSIGLI